MDFRENYITESPVTEEKTTRFRRTIGACRVAVFVLAVVCVALLIALIVVSVKYRDDTSHQPDYSCAERSKQIDLEPPAVLPPFHDLTDLEIGEIKDFLYRDKELNLVRPPDLKTNSSYIFTMELHIPNKDVTLNFLDNGRAQPPREAKVVLFRGDKPQTYVEEYIVGPLPYPVYKKDQKTIPFRYRPITLPELIDALFVLNHRVHSTVPNVLEESYGGQLIDCGDKCLKFSLMTPSSSALTDDPMTRKMWFWLAYAVEYKTIQHLDFQVLMDLTSSKKDEYNIEKVLYAGQTFDSLEELEQAYKFAGPKTKIPFPTTDRDLFSSANRRGNLFPEEPLSPPEQYEPSGHRYSIKGKHISYMRWNFDVRMSPISGPQLFDIRYGNERIVYELSLQEISVLYSASNPAHRFMDVADSVAMIGLGTRSLVPGTDCPNHATFLYTPQMHEYLDGTLMTTFCVFEHNTAMPLRRHHSSSDSKFYEGMVDSVLNVRTITTIDNYDYIIDFIFHQNGALEVKVVPTGFLLTSFWQNGEEDYGFRLAEHVTGNIHHHLFHFKIDMDINGRENRFETLDIVPVEVDNSKWSKATNARYAQTKFVRKQVQTEREAALKYNFDNPKYLTFYNTKFKSEYGVPKAYRLLVRGMSKQLYPEGAGQELSFSWARYQVAVTKYKDSERRSSSMYATLDGRAPIVNFQTYIDDNEVISDEDQVTWVTMGVHHIPHTEDLPMTPTVGLDLQFFLLPYNYFPEDPSMGSSDAVRIEPKNKADISHGVKIERYGKAANTQCIPREALYQGMKYSDVLQKHPWILFDP